MTDYVINNLSEVKVAGEVSITADTQKSLTNLNYQVVPLRKMKINVNPYKIVRGVPVDVGVADYTYSPVTTTAISKSNYLYGEPTQINISDKIDYRWSFKDYNGTYGNYEPEWLLGIFYNQGYDQNNQTFEILAALQGYSAEYLSEIQAKYDGDFLLVGSTYYQEENPSGIYNGFYSSYGAITAYTNKTFPISSGFSGRLKFINKVVPITEKDRKIFLYTPQQYAQANPMAVAYEVSSDKGDYATLLITTQNKHSFFEGQKVLMPSAEPEAPSEASVIRVSGASSFATGTYHFYVTSYNDAGESFATSLGNLSLTSSHQAVLVLPKINNTVGYKIYIGTTIGESNSRFQTITNSEELVLTSYSSSGAAAPTDFVSRFWGGETTWLGEDDGDVYTVDSIVNDKQFAVLAKKNYQPETPAYGFASWTDGTTNRPYITPTFTPEIANETYESESYLFNVAKSKFEQGRLNHFYTVGSGLQAVDEMTLYAVFNSYESEQKTSIMSPADVSIYENGKIYYNESISSRVDVITLTRTNNVVTATIDAPGLDLEAGDVIEITESRNSSFNGSFTVLSASSQTTFTYNNAGTNATSTGGFCSISSLSQDEKYAKGNIFIEKQGGDILFGDDISEPHRISASFTSSAEFPITTLVTANNEEITAYVSSKYGTNSKTVFRKNKNNRVNLLPNSDFEVNSNGWSGGTRANDGLSFYGSYYYKFNDDIVNKSTLTLSNLSRNTAGLITLNFVSDHGLSVGDYVVIYGPDYGFTTNSVWNTNFGIRSTLIAKVNTVTSSKTFTVLQENSSLKQSTYTSFTNSAGVNDNPFYMYKLGAVLTDNISLSGYANVGVSYSVLTDDNSPNGYGTFLDFYDSSNALLESRYIGNYEQTTVTDMPSVNYGEYKRNKHFVKDFPANTSYGILSIVGFSRSNNLSGVDAVVVEPSPINYNYFSGNGPKLDTRYVIGRPNGKFSPENMFKGSIVECGMSFSKLSDNDAKEIIYKLKTVYGG
jgi:hypothetical protein